ncbi:hypothetical protein M2352_003389 [Azospirillum fermentarium]|uniref:CHAT domain-containing protein n=1 Tax=Azospirillum fermentarium TaxID=1233114 RepID=UPI0022278D78|nr:CHAT domain-containing protein [Azospirillum fermentarium]MCW2247755.1 hypothetical protein [Azospirillum fermentarium]
MAILLGEAYPEWDTVAIESLRAAVDLSASFDTGAYARNRLAYILLRQHNSSKLDQREARGLASSVLDHPGTQTGDRAYAHALMAFADVPAGPAAWTAVEHHLQAVVTAVPTPDGRLAEPIAELLLLVSSHVVGHMAGPRGSLSLALGRAIEWCAAVFTIVGPVRKAITAQLQVTFHLARTREISFEEAQRRRKAAMLTLSEDPDADMRVLIAAQNLKLALAYSTADALEDEAEILEEALRGTELSNHVLGHGQAVLGARLVATGKSDAVSRGCALIDSGVALFMSEDRDEAATALLVQLAGTLVRSEKGDRFANALAGRNFLLQAQAIVERSGTDIDVDPVRISLSTCVRIIADLGDEEPAHMFISDVIEAGRIRGEAKSAEVRAGLEHNVANLITTLDGQSPNALRLARDLLKQSLACREEMHHHAALGTALDLAQAYYRLALLENGKGSASLEAAKGMCSRLEGRLDSSAPPLLHIAVAVLRSQLMIEDDPDTGTLRSAAEVLQIAEDTCGSTELLVDLAKLSQLKGNILRRCKDLPRAAAAYRDAVVRLDRAAREQVTGAALREMLGLRSTVCSSWSECLAEMGQLFLAILVDDEARAALTAYHLASGTKNDRRRQLRFLSQGIDVTGLAGVSGEGPDLRLSFDAQADEGSVIQMLARSLPPVAQVLTISFNQYGHAWVLFNRCGDGNDSIGAVPVPILTRTYVSKWAEIPYDGSSWRQRLDHGSGGIVAGTEALLREVGHRLMESVSGLLRTARISPDSPVYLVHDGAIAHLPLKAAELPDGRRTIDHMNICLSPRLRPLPRPATSSPIRPALVVATALNLPVATAEASAVARLYGPEAKLLLGPDATKDAILSHMHGSNVVHFAGHGARQAIQAWDGPLSFEQIAADVDLSATGVVVMVACHSARAESGPASAEQLGLATAALIAGARGVVGSIWACQDVASGLFSYRLHTLISQGIEADRAVHAAQLWLRNLPRQQAREILQNDLYLLHTSRFLTELGSDKPFEHPEAWAPFIYFGFPFEHPQK